MNWENANHWESEGEDWENGNEMPKEKIAIPEYTFPKTESRGIASFQFDEPQIEDEAEMRFIAEQDRKDNFRFN